MKLFRKKSASTANNEVAQTIAQNIIGKQKLLATYLNTKTRDISSKSWLAILIVFCAVFGSYCAFLLIRALG
jgi:hypothetical protein